MKSLLYTSGHPSINAIENKFSGGDVFLFQRTRKRGNSERNPKLNNKASQHSDIPTKIIKSSSDIFSDFLYVSNNSSIKSSLFPTCLKTADITLIYKKGKRDLKDIIDL